MGKEKAILEILHYCQQDIPSTCHHSARCASKSQHVSLLHRVPTLDFVASACCLQVDTCKTEEGRDVIWLNMRSGSFHISVSLRQYHSAMPGLLPARFMEDTPEL